LLRANLPPLILSLETATRAGSLAIARGDHVLVERGGDASISHSTDLLEQVKDALGAASLSLREINAVAVAAGPGSFTGLRIGLATAKSFAATLDIPCVGIPTLYAVARSAGASRCTIAMLQAGRGEVYAQKLSVTAEGGVRPLEPPAHLAPEILFKRVSGIRNLKWAGEAAQVYIETIKTYALAQGLEFQHGRVGAPGEDNAWVVIEAAEVLAADVARLAAGLYPFEGGASAQDLQAIYVRPSDAELNA
jgi:tRNA threonylcarbamoyladenosine biosynthesis protein TsaB